MYLYWFERILRQASGDPTLALPYWNYSDSDDQRALPVPFRSSTNDDGTPNPLYVSQRNSGINNGQPLPSADVSYANAFSYTNFESPSGSGESFGGQEVSGANHFNSPHGQLETKPHDQVHVNIGGWMGDPNTAARDPIFWLHHANIDRLWQRWLNSVDRSANPTQNDAWMNTQFTFFDEKGNQVQQSAKDILNTVQQLNYQYDGETSLSKAVVKTQLPATKLARKRQQLAKASSARLTPPVWVKQKLLSQSSDQQQVTQLRDAPATVSVPLLEAPELASPKMPSALSPQKSRFVLNISGIEYDPRNLIPYDIYINPPEGVTFNTESSYYVGKLAVFAYPQGGTFSIDVTNRVSQLENAKISVTFAPSTDIAPAVAPQAQSSSSTIRFQQVTITRT
jgi:tyrosinase